VILLGFHVDGFGVHRDLRCDGLSPGLNLVVGPNEAGKSTLHAFLRGMLVGFPDGRSKESSHPPVHGGAHGGRLWLRTEAGEFVVERRLGAKRRVEVRGPGGIVGGQELLDRLTGGADARLYRGVFAFGLAELAGLEALATQEVAARLFDAGLAGEGQAAAEAIADLAARRGRELSPRGGRIRELARELEGAERALRTAADRARGHGEVLSRLEEEREGLAAARRRLDQAREESRRYALLRSLWPLELRRREGEAVLAAEGDAAEVAADAVARFDGAREAERVAAAALAGREEALAGLRAERRRLEERGGTPARVAGAGHRLAARALAVLALLLGLGAVAALGLAGGAAALGWAVAAVVAGGLGWWLRAAAAVAERSRREDGTRREALASLAGRIAALDEERGRLAGEAAAAAARWAAVLAEAGAADREGLVRRTRRWSRVAAAREAVEEARRGLALALGEAVAGGAEGTAGKGRATGEGGGSIPTAGIREALASGDPVAWAEAQARAEGEAERLAGEVEERARRVGALEGERRELEASADVPRLAAAVAAREAELSDAVRRYREAAFVERLLAEVLEVHRRERQPEVLRRAGEAFARITGGRYLRVIQAATPDALEVIDRDGRCLPVEVLSRGTREQLYVCVRLGLAAAVAARGTSLPLLLDDVLVDFDPERAAATAKVLAEFAREHQVLVFTCHPATVALLGRHAPMAPVLDLAAAHGPAGEGPAAGPEGRESLGFREAGGEGRR
jgi:uncharacterized protein YhaN